MRARLFMGLAWPAGVIVCALAAIPAIAQVANSAQVTDSADAAYASASPPSNPTDGNTQAGTASDAGNDNDILGHALIFDPASLADTGPSKPLNLPGLPAPKPMDVSRTDQPDGSSTVVVKKPLATEWDSTVGADLGLAATPPESLRAAQSLPGLSNGSGSGAAWASVGVTQFASVDARLDPTNDQGKFGTTLKHAIPLGQRFSVTLQDTSSVTQTFNPATASPSGLSNLPLMTLPAATASTSAPTPAPLHVWGNDNSLKFNVLSTGTTFGAGVTTLSNDPITHNTLSADQKVYGPLHVTTAVTDAGQPTVNKSISAGLKLNW
ncbi:MAG TPA: hypothetical protein VHW95_03840 [Steroidobacteraceae bacterium]|nr:hypothetical protein [Steroidobacteraceae bacterium]